MRLASNRSVMPIAACVQLFITVITPSFGWNIDADGWCVGRALAWCMLDVGAAPCARASCAPAAKEGAACMRLASAPFAAGRPASLNPHHHHAF